MTPPAPAQAGSGLFLIQMPPNAALHGIAVDHLMRWNLLALLVCFAAAHAWLIFAIFRRKRSISNLKQDRQVLKVEAPDSSQERMSPKHKGLQPWTFSRSLTWILLPILCIMYAWMAITAQRLWAANRFEGASPQDMQVEVTGQQFQWYFRYPGEDARFGLTQPARINAAAGNPLGLDPNDARGVDDLVSSVLVLPVGREVDLRLRSLDVIHGFFIPAMRLKQNAVPGLVLHIHFTPIATGTYPILCSQVCGSGHARMQAELHVVSPAVYHDWLQAKEQQHARETAQ
jgi:cytochrome c oxidase subunit 2